MICVIVDYLFLPGKHPIFRNKVQKVLQGLNLVQLVNSVVMLTTVWQQREETSWVHLRFLIDTTGCAAWAVLFTVLACPGYLHSSPLIIPGLLVVLPLSGLVMSEMFTKMQIAVDMGCVEPQALPQYISGFSIVSGIITLLFIIFGVYDFSNKLNLDHERFEQHKWILLPLVAFSATGLTLELVWQYIDYSDLNHLFKSTEDVWSFSQKVQIGLISAGAGQAIWVGSDLDGKLSMK